MFGVLLMSAVYLAVWWRRLPDDQKASINAEEQKRVPGDW